ncbi:unnamed protein product [Rotaria magnacalcarata]
MEDEANEQISPAGSQANNEDSSVNEQSADSSEEKSVMGENDYDREIQPPKKVAQRFLSHLVGCRHNNFHIDSEIASFESMSEVLEKDLEKLGFSLEGGWGSQLEDTVEEVEGSSEGTSENIPAIDQEFDEVARRLFNGVASFYNMSYTSALLPLAADTRAVVTSKDGKLFLVVAARLGQGRCLLFGRPDYMNYFGKNASPAKPEETLDPKFVENAKQWVSRNRWTETLRIDETDQWASIDVEDKILVWKGTWNKSEEFINSLCDYLENGGALICGASHWQLDEFYSDIETSKIGFNRLCSKLGVALMDKYLTEEDTEPLKFSPDLVAFRNFSNIFQTWMKDPSQSRISSMICELIDIIRSNPSQIASAISSSNLVDAVENIDSDLIPSKSNKIKDNNLKTRAKAFNAIAFLLPDFKLPGIKEFPGDFDEPPETVTNEVVTVKKLQSGEWYCTGHYVVAGLPFEMKVIEQTGESGWYVQIGSHTDDLTDCDEYRRWPVITTSQRIPKLLSESINMYSPVGGLLYLVAPTGDEASSITVQLSNVVPTPTYDLTDANRETKWNTSDTEALDRVLELYDNIVLAGYDLCGTTSTSRERLVCDEQISCGYMHSGYPIMSHLDYLKLTERNIPYILDEKALRNYGGEGEWGIPHELGHNRQKDWWTFSDTDDITCNIFSLYVTNTVYGRDLWEISVFGGSCAENAIAYLSGSNQSFEEWKKDYYVGLTIYGQLAREFGWDSFKAIFRTYENTQPELNSDQEKIDLWVKTFSEQVQKNLVPLFQLWGLIVSDAIANKLEDFDIPKIDDQFIQAVPGKYPA